MAYLFQHGPAILSGAVDQEGSIDIKDDGSGTFELKHDGNTIISSARALGNVTTISGAAGVSAASVSVNGNATLLQNGNVAAAANVTAVGSVSGAAGLAGLGLTIQAGQAIGVNGDTDLMILSANSVAVRGAHSASTTLAGRRLTIDSGAQIGTSTDSDLLTLADGALRVTGEMSASTLVKGRGLVIEGGGEIGTATDGNLLTLADNSLRISGELSASSVLKGYDLVIQAGRRVGTSGDADLMTLNNNELVIAGDLTASADLKGLKVVAESYEILDVGVIDSTRNLTAVGVSGSSDLQIGGTVRFDGVVEATVQKGANQDGLFFRDSSDSGKMKFIDIKDFVDGLAGSGLSATDGVLSTQAGAVRVIDDSSSLSEGYNFYTGSAAKSVTLPASPSVGDVVVIKAGDLGSGNGLTVSRAGSQTIDGMTSVVLESDYAAASFVYLENNNWGII